MRLIFEPADRPPTVAWFEWLSISLLIYDCIYDRIVSEVPWLAIIAYALLMLWIIVAISRRSSRVARWFLTALDAIAYVAFLFQLATGDAEVRKAMLGGGDTKWAAFVLSLVTLWLLWSRPMSRWIASQPEVGTKSPA